MRCDGAFDRGGAMRCNAMNRRVQAMRCNGDALDESRPRDAFRHVFPRWQTSGDVQEHPQCHGLVELTLFSRVYLVQST